MNALKQYRSFGFLFAIGFTINVCHGLGLAFNENHIFSEAIIDFLLGAIVSISILPFFCFPGLLVHFALRFFVSRDADSRLAGSLLMSVFSLLIMFWNQMVLQNESFEFNALYWLAIPTLSSILGYFLLLPKSARYVPKGKGVDFDYF